MRYDAIIIGGSFAGLSAAMQLGRANRSVCVIDTGTPRNRFATASHGFFGQDGVTSQMTSTIASGLPTMIARTPSVHRLTESATNALSYCLSLEMTCDPSWAKSTNAEQTNDRGPCRADNVESP
jgi:thioredoxin reductase